MLQKKKFMNTVFERSGNNIPVAVGDTVDFILQSGAVQTETLTTVEDSARWLGWESSVNGTRKEDVRAVESVHHKDCTQYA